MVAAQRPRGPSRRSSGRGRGQHEGHVLPRHHQQVAEARRRGSRRPATGDSPRSSPSTKPPNSARCARRSASAAGLEQRPHGAGSPTASHRPSPSPPLDLVGGDRRRPRGGGPPTSSPGRAGRHRAGQRRPAGPPAAAPSTRPARAAGPHLVVVALGPDLGHAPRPPTVARDRSPAWPSARNGAGRRGSVALPGPRPEAGGHQRRPPRPARTGRRSGDGHRRDRPAPAHHGTGRRPPGGQRPTAASATAADRSLERAGGRSAAAPPSARPHPTCGRIWASLAGPMPRTPARSSTDAEGTVLAAVADDGRRGGRAHAGQRVELVGRWPC